MNVQSCLRRAVLSMLCLASAIGLLSCDGSASDEMAASTSSETCTIVCTVGMVADIARHVAAERANVKALIGSGVDPHLYSATRDDVAALMDADIIFYSGLMLEGKMSDVLIKVGREKPVHAVTESIDPASLLEPEEMGGHADPHVWMDASAWGRCAVAVGEAMAAFDPEHAAEYRDRAQTYAAECEALHEYGIACIATIPADSRVLVTSHDAFNYFGRAYGLDVRGVQGISTESEAGLQDINALVDFLVERRVRAVFIETSVSPKNIQALIDGARARGHEVVIGGELFSDAMGAEGTHEGTYLGMIDHNITIVTRALGGEAPKRGYRGLLSDQPH